MLAFGLDAFSFLSVCWLFAPLIWAVRVQQPLRTLRTAWQHPAPLLAGLPGEASLRVLRGQLGQCLVPVRESCSSSLCPPLGPVGGSWWRALCWSHLCLYAAAVTAPCLSGKPSVLLNIPSVAIVPPLQAPSTRPSLVLSLGLTSEACAGVPSPHPQ